MICYKCGSELPDGVKFCRKCGAKLLSDNIEQQAAPVDIPKKKKFINLPLILGLVILAIAILATIPVVILIGRHNDDTSSDSGVSLSKVYTNEAEGISFQYPSAWKLSDPAEYYSDPYDIQASVVLLVNDAGGQGINAIIEVLKFSADQGDIEHLYINDEEFAATFDDDVSIIETSLVEIDGIEARRIAYIEQDELYYLSYMYGNGNALYRVNFICSKTLRNSQERFFDTVMESYTITTTAETQISSNLVTDDNDYFIFAEALWNLITYNILPDGEIANDLDGKIDSMGDKFAICDINQDGTAELLIKIEFGSTAVQGQHIYQVNSDHSGLEMLCSFFTDVVYYDTGFIKEDWSHNQGLSDNFWPYSILQWEPGGCREVAGADAWEKMAWETDFSGKAFPDEVDTDGNGIVYFIGGENGIDYDNPVDDAEYNAFVKKYFSAGNEIYVPWRDITAENVEVATGYTSTASDSTEAQGGLAEDMPMETGMPIEYYEELAGAYIGNMPDSAVYLSIYSSWEEGEIAIGVAEIYGPEAMFFYYGEVAELYENTYIVATDSGEAVLLVVQKFSESIQLILYIDGEYIDEYWMVEHYEF